MVSGMLNLHPQDAMTLVEGQRKGESRDSFVKFYEKMMAEDEA
jgi:hypothetical protein